MIHFEVAVTAPIIKTLTYALPLDLLNKTSTELENHVGKRVLVPLSKRRVTGYILAVTEDKATDFVVKNIAGFLDSHPLFHENVIPFFRWVATYYQYPLGLVIKGALPGGLAPRSVKKLVLSPNYSKLTCDINVDSVLWFAKLLDKGELSASETRKILYGTSTRKQLNSLLKEDKVKIIESVQKDSTREKLEICYSLTANPESVVLEGSDGSVDFKKYRQIFSEEYGIQLKLSETKALYYLKRIGQQTKLKKVPLKDLKNEYSGSAKALAELETKDIVLRSSNRVYRNPFGDQHCFHPRPRFLTDEQSMVLGQISRALAVKSFQPFLLHGVTGCGKTEVYLQAAEITLAAGRDVLILVPEIALATQLEAHLISRFGDLVVLQHSGMTKSERFDQYHLALTGKAKVVVGARSALFAPLRDPGLIVVDEEHDAGFKQDDSFRYHGRDAAVVRARFHNAVILLGSATPSVTSYANAQSGKYKLLTMLNRVGERSLPEVTVVDLNKDKSPRKTQTIRSELLEGLAGNLESGSQSLLLLNRRGFSSSVLCQQCGTPVLCTHCNVSLTFHKRTNRLLCHYCGFSINAETKCFECGSTDLFPAGFGIERVAEEVSELFPAARVQRIDSDTASDRRKFLQILKDMYHGNIDILIGTQMIAKGHHFPNVTLVGVVWADGGLNMPDFRAAEKSFQLITQVTGRAGRGDLPGKVIIQTLRPEHYAIVYAKKHQYLEMFEKEMSLRSSPSFPPFVRLIAVHVQGRVERSVQKSALNIGRFSKKCVTKHKYDIKVLGPAPSPLDKIKDNYRWQLLFKGSDSNELHELCVNLEMEKTGLVNRHCKVKIDVDPENMM